MSENREVFNTLKSEWQKFLLNLVCQGMNQTNAYIDCYPDSSPEAAKSSASELLTNPNVSEAYKELQSELKEKAQISAEWVMNGLVELINDAKNEDKVDVNALKGCYNELNKMIGGHAPEKIDHTSGGKTIKNDWHIHPVTTSKDGS